MSTETEKYELEETIKELEGYKGRHTELISVYIPAGYELTQVGRQIEDEKGTATNIKSTSTRKNVLQSLEKISRQLKIIGRTPENGLAIFAGNVSEVEGQQDFQIWTIELPKPLRIRLYRCDQTFVLEPLKQMIETEDIYGLLVIERKEATIGLLEGKTIKILQHMTSGIPGSVRAGGQCLAPDTLIIKDNGELIEIKDSHNPLLIMSENFNTEKTEQTPLITKWENERELFKIITTYPRFEIRASKEHLFFTRTEKGIEQKPLSEIKQGDYLIMPEVINIKGSIQQIDFNPIIKQDFNIKKINIPDFLDLKLAKILGYYLGDGNYEIDRISFSEQREDVAKYYKTLIETYFGLNSNLKFREKKSYWQLRFHSRILSQFINSFFSRKQKTLEQAIPQIILKSPDEILASFISGFFDAEGYVSGNRVAFGINNKILTKQMQLVLLRLGIISSLLEYDNRRNPYSDKIRYTLEINDIESLKKFQKAIGFCSCEKRKKLFDLINKRSNKNRIRQILINGKDVAKIIRNSGLNTRQFRCPDFFVNKKQMSKEVFKKNILDNISDLELKKRLEMFYNSNLIAIKISKIESIGFSKTIDIETKNHNFIANGFIVHNSAARFHRVIEGLAKEFFRRVSEEMKKHFFDMKKLKGILVGGPIPTKEEFLESGNLVTALKEKVIAVKDIGDVQLPGLKALVDASQEELAEQEITKQKKILDEFFTTLAKEPDKITYGEQDTEEKLKTGAVDKLIISKNLEKSKIRKFESLANKTSAEIHIISEETSEGVQFENLGGVGGILRFAMA